jgi:Amt family ammonium transporter
VSLIIFKVIDATTGLRVDGDEETQGLDITQHGESGYTV